VVYPDANDCVAAVPVSMVELYKFGNIGVSVHLLPFGNIMKDVHSHMKLSAIFPPNRTI
jgi:hypothetical protein